MVSLVNRRVSDFRAHVGAHIELDLSTCVKCRHLSLSPTSLPRLPATVTTLIRRRGSDCCNARHITHDTGTLGRGDLAVVAALLLAADRCCEGLSPNQITDCHAQLKARARPRLAGRDEAPLPERQTLPRTG